MKKIGAKLFLAMGGLLLGAIPAVAASVLEDHGATTIDPNTHLEWLDLTATTNQSYNAVLAGFGSYTTTGGYHFATSDQVTQLFIDAGWDGVTTISSSSPPGDDVAQAASVLLSLLGTTAQGGPESAGTGFIKPTTTGVIKNTALYDLVIRSSGLLAVLRPTFQFEDPDTAGAGLGSFLVRPVAATPLPTALPLFATALVGLGAAARRRRANRSG
jgi:hypothetical protein